MPNKYLIPLIFLILLSILLEGCFLFSPLPKEEESNLYSYHELENMEEITIQEDRICIVLYENQAIPYRWSEEIHSSYGELIYDATIDGEGSWNAVGDSPAYHIFIYEMKEDGEAEIEINLTRMNDPAEISDQRRYLLLREHDVVTYENTSPNVE